VQSGDVALVLSFSGETDEVVRLLPSLARMQVPLVAITGRATSSLGQQARVVLDLGPLQEACWMGLAPTTSTTAMMALGDAVALVLSRMRRFAADDFARYHPAGSLGRKLAKVEDVMRPLTECRLAPHDKTVRQVLIEVSKPGRRTGAIMLLDGEGRLQGIFTDSDLARLLERKRDADIDGPVSQVMTRRPKTITCGASLSQAVRVFIDSKISELPVVDDAGRPRGLVDVTDIVGMLPQDDVGADPASPPQLPAMVRPLTVVFPGSDGETSGDET
jgi:arabinose-5-phosphate isomerase